ncbi:MAG: hypothetical protein OK422_05200 [Thaumarchaeota archaeon]|nr:hypothetical protein [Nitrososphaerota archaeon]
MPSRTRYLTVEEIVEINRRVLKEIKVKRMRLRRSKPKRAMFTGKPPPF